MAPEREGIVHVAGLILLLGFMAIVVVLDALRITTPKVDPVRDCRRFDVAGSRRNHDVLDCAAPPTRVLHVGDVKIGGGTLSSSSR